MSANREVWIARLVWTRVKPEATTKKATTKKATTKKATTKKATTKKGMR